MIGKENIDKIIDKIDDTIEKLEQKFTLEEKLKIIDFCIKHDMTYNDCLFDLYVLENAIKQHQEDVENGEFD